MYKPIICIGDSITHGFPFGPAWSWVAVLNRLLPVEVINRGVNGDTTSDMLFRFQTDVLNHNPSITVIMGGTNDAWLGAGLDIVKANLTAMAERSRKQHVLPVMGLPVPLSPGGDDDFFPGLEETSQILDHYRTWIEDYCQVNDLPVIDFYTPMLTPGSAYGRPAYFLDGVHPSQKGYLAMAEAALPAMKQLIEEL